MFIQTEDTPNPMTLKFIPGTKVLPNDTAEFNVSSDNINSPLARSLFKIDGVNSIFLGDDFISVTKSDEDDWFSLKPQILAEIMTFFSSGQKIIDADTNDKINIENESDISKQIRELIDTRVRPAVAMDGGDIVFHSFEDGVVSLEMRGACNGCPSSTATLKMGIENMLKHYIPEVKEVVPKQ